MFTNNPYAIMNYVIILFIYKKITGKTFQRVN